MTTADTVVDARARRRPARRRWRWFSRRPAHHPDHRLPDLAAADRLALRQLAAPGQRSADHRLVERLPAAVRVHARQLPAGADREQHGTELPEQPAHHHPGHGHPDPGGRLRGLCLRVDGLPRPQCPLHPGGRTAGHPAAVGADPGPAAQHQPRRHRIVPGGLAGPHGIRAARSPSSCCATSSGSFPRRCSNRPTSTARHPRPRSSGWCCRCRCRPSRRWSSSSSCSSGTICWWR